MITRGLEVVYPPPGEALPASYGRQLDIVFVHGLGRDSIQTWHHDASGKTWISDPEFLGSLKRFVRVLTYTYNPDIAANMNSASIGLHATELLELVRICYDRSGGGPTLFIAHGFGGTIMKKFVEAYSTRSYHMAEDSASGIIFLGTPHATADADAILQSIKATAALHSDDKSPLSLSDMREYAASVRHTNAELRSRMLQKLDIVDVPETQPTPFYDDETGSHYPITVVPKESARLRSGKPLRLDLDCTHIGLASFASPTDPNFQKLHEILVKMANRAKQNGKTILPIGPFPPPMLSSMPMPQPGPPPLPLPSPSPPPPYGGEKIEINRRNIKPPPGPRLPIGSSAHFQDWMKKRDAEDSVKACKILLDSLRGWTEANSGNNILPMPGTCSWIRASPVFKTWVDSPGSTALLCYGSSGCGKTHWAKSIYNHLLATRPMDVVVSFFNRGVQTESSKPAILEFIIYHILRRRPEWFHEIPSFYWDRQPDSPPLSLESLADILLHIKRNKKPDTVFFIIDGVGDCDLEFTRKLLRLVAVLVDQFGPEKGTPGTMPHQDEPVRMKFKFLFTSHINEVISSAPCFTGVKGALTAGDEDIRRDISTYVDGHLNRLVDGMPSNFVDERRTWIKEQAGTFFTFAALACADLLTSTVGDRLGFGETELKCPEPIRRHYDKHFLPLVQSVDNNKYSLEAICMMAGTYPETFSLQQLSNALQCLHDDVDLGGLRLLPLLSQQCSRLLDLSTRCSGLVHPSFHQYLLDLVSPGDLHSFMTELCVKYLSRTCFKTYPWAEAKRSDTRSTEAILEESYPFYDYAAKYWRSHLAHANTTSKSLLRQLDVFLAEDSAQHKTWHHYMEWAMSNKDSIDSESEVPPPFFALISSDQVDLIQRFLPTSWRESNSDTRNGNMRNGTANWALSVSRRLSSLVQSPASHQWPGIPNRITGTLGRTPLHVSVSTVAKSALALFISIGVDVNFRAPSIGETALFLACRQYHDACMVQKLDNGADDAEIFVELATMLLEAGADPNIPAVDGVSCLHEVCRTGRLELVEVLLQHGANVNVSNLRGETVLEFAVWENQTATIQRLIDAGVDVDAKFSDGDTAIANAIERRNVDAFRILVRNSKDINQHSHYGLAAIHHVILTHQSHLLPELLQRPDLQLDLLTNPPVPYLSVSALNCAITSQDYLAAQLLLSAGANPGYIPGMESRLPLAHAVCFCPPSFVTLLLQYGAPVNGLDKDPILRDRTALSNAVASQRDDLVRILLDHGADPTIEEAYELQGLLTRAAMKGNLSAARMLLRNSIPPSVDYKTARQRHAFFSVQDGPIALEFLNLLLDHGADPQAMFEKTDRQSPMHHAAQGGFLDVCKLLVEHDPSYLDMQHEGGLMNQTPLHWAAQGGQLDVVKYLLEAGARADALSFWYRGSAFGRACSQGFLEVAKVLYLASPELLDHRTCNGINPLLNAFHRGTIATVEYLLELGANPRAVDFDGSSCARLALERDVATAMQLVRLLVRHNVGPNEVIGSGKYTMLGEACKMGNVPVVRYLLENGGDPLHCHFSHDGSGDRNALRVAVHFRESAVVELLLERPDIRDHLSHIDWVGQSVLSLEPSRWQAKTVLTKLYLVSEEILKETGCDPFADLMKRRDDFGRSPADVARDGIHQLPPLDAIPSIRRQIREHALSVARVKRGSEDLATLDDLVVFLNLLGGPYDDQAISIMKRISACNDIRQKDGKYERYANCRLLCDRCNDGMGDRMHICRMCPQVFCVSCSEKEGSKGEHSILEIPFDKSPDLNTEEFQQLLDFLIEEFANDEEDEDVAAMRGVNDFVDPNSETTTLSLAVLHAFGLLEFQRRAWSPSIGLARAVYQRLEPWHGMIRPQRAVVQRRMLETELAPDRMKAELDYFLGSGRRTGYMDEEFVRYGWTLESLAPMFVEEVAREDHTKLEFYERTISESEHSAYEESAI